MPDRILNVLNLILVLASIGCVYYLATATYERPRELDEARELIEIYKDGGEITESTMNPQVDGVETTAGPRPIAPRPKPASSMVAKAFMKPLYTPPPTPTPPPPPPPAPPNLESAVYAWQISSIIDDRTVEFMDQRTQESFIMTIGGPPKETPDKDGKTVSVILSAVDMNELKVTLSFGDQQNVKSFL